MRDYLWNVLIAATQLINTIAGGHPHETLCGRIGKYVHSKTLPNCVPCYHACRLFCRALDLIDPGHCAASIAGDRLRNREKR